MAYYYSDPERENDLHALPNLEVFYAGWGELTPQDDLADGAEPNEAGWYWRPCFPGCLPDGEPNGPFETEEEALADARSW